MTNADFLLQLNQNETWNMDRLHFHDHFELLLPLTSPGNIFVNDQVYPSMTPEKALALIEELRGKG